MALEAERNFLKLSHFLLTFLLIRVTVATHIHSICLEQCWNQSISGDTTYQECMSDCYASHNTTWLMRTGGSCGFVDIYHPDSSPVCSAEDINVVSKPKLVSNVFDNHQSNREFLAITWSPCPYGIYDVKGYEVTLVETELVGFSLCKRTVLKTKLQAENLNETFSLLFNEHYLDYSTKYEVWVEGLPKTSRRHYAFIEYNSLPCTELNGYGSCECGLSGFKTLPVPEVLSIGYSVLVNVTVLNECFGIHRYLLSLLHLANSTISVLQTQTLIPQMGMNYLVHTFSGVYPPKGKLLVQYRAFSEYGRSRPSDSVTLDIKEYKPIVTSVYSEDSTISVAWKCADALYNITKYEVKLNRHTFDSIKINSEIVYDVASTCVDRRDSTMKKTFNVLRSGTYSVQVRGHHVYSPHFQAPIWSSLSNETYVQAHNEVINAGDAKAVALTMFSIVVIVIVGVAILYSSKKGYCRKIRHQLPISMDALLSSSTFNHSSKTVWIIWQADPRGGAYRDLHCENIRHLASYFSNHCGLRIILDQYEHLSLSNLSLWISQKTKEAEIVLFICPHFALTEYDTLLLQPEAVGNFLGPFKFYKNCLLKDVNSPKFITVSLPYNKANSCPVVDLLLQTTPVFQLMDHIEDLYFFMQGRSKVNRLGRYVLENISGSEYLRTQEGKALQSGIKRMMLLQERDVSLSEDSESYMPSAVTEQLLLDVSRSSLESMKPVVALREEVLLGTPCDFKPNPPPAVIEDEDPNTSLFMIETKDLLSVKYLANNSFPHVRTY